MIPLFDVVYAKIDDHPDSSQRQNLLTNRDAYPDHALASPHHETIHQDPVKTKTLSNAHHIIQHNQNDRYQHETDHVSHTNHQYQ
jgi:hypothetical protein